MDDQIEIIKIPDPIAKGKGSLLQKDTRPHWLGPEVRVYSFASQIYTKWQWGLAMRYTDTRRQNCRLDTCGGTDLPGVMMIPNTDI